MAEISKVDEYWSCPEDELFRSLGSSPKGLSSGDAAARKDKVAPLKAGIHAGGLRLFLRQFKSPVTLMLVAASIVSLFLGQHTDAAIILVIIISGGILGSYQEKGAARSLAKLLKLVQINTFVIRDGVEVRIPLGAAVPGDIVLLNAGQTIPGDCRLLTSKDLYMNEASLTGETFPAEKKCGQAAVGASLADRHNILLMGTHVVSGTATALVVRTGASTEFGKISQHLRTLQPETEFEKGIRRFGYLLMEVTLMLVTIIFSFNIFLHRPLVDSFLFSLAIAVGLTPQLLPAIISINLAKGAGKMAARAVIVKRLSAIENFGSMNILCTDKTGTITKGEIVLHKALNYAGQEDPDVFRMAWINAFFETGFNNPIDKAIKDHGMPDITGIVKLDELPYDFIRKRLSILVSDKGACMVITKGAFEEVIAICSHVNGDKGQVLVMEDTREQLKNLYTRFSEEGYRVLGVAYKSVGQGFGELKKEHEQDLVFAGMLLLSDPPKEGVSGTLQELHQLGISVKMITGDNEWVARHICRQVGLTEPVILTGVQIRQMSTEALIRQATTTNIFASVEPNQKERILLALKKGGHVVGFMGDGINDAPALHSADVGISVHGAADVAREAADIVLLENDLEVLVEGVKEGRKTFANTLKYIFMATSANFGNMFSMAGASLFLTYLPLLPKQVLLTNLLTDIPEMTIAMDAVDPAMVTIPHRIDVKFIRKFMIVFGIISSFFDFATFWILLHWLKAGTAEFRTGWFIESVVSAALIVLVVRTPGPFLKNRPGKWLILSTSMIVVVTLILPFTPLAHALGFTILPGRFYLFLGGVICCYIVTAELVKRGRLILSASKNS
jgi:Mg2+-importing ATPase